MQMKDFPRRETHTKTHRHCGTWQLCSPRKTYWLAPLLSEWLSHRHTEVHVVYLNREARRTEVPTTRGLLANRMIQRTSPQNRMELLRSQETWLNEKCKKSPPHATARSVRRASWRLTSQDQITLIISSLEDLKQKKFCLP